MEIKGMLYMILLLLPISLLVGIVFCFIKKLRLAGKIITVVSIAIILFTAAFFAITLFWLSGGSPYVDDSVFLVPIFGVPLFTVAALVFGLFAWKKKWGKIVTLALAGFLIISVIYPTVTILNNIGIAVVTEASPEEDYDPYAEDSKIALLDGEASFRLESDYPRLDGATALYPVYSAFFRAVYPDEFREDPHRLREKYLRLSTTTGAYIAIVNGDADIIFVASASEKQQEYARENGVELEFIPLGSEAFVFFVNEKNPLNDISLKDVKRIYTGDATEWRELGVDGLGEIIAFQRDEGSGSQTALENLIGKENLIKAPGREVSTMSGIVYSVADYKNYKNAIGYSFRYYATVMNGNSGLKLLSLNGVEPTVDNIKNGTYPVSGNFYAVIRSDAGENVREFIDWMRSAEGQEIIEKTGYVPLY